MPTLAPGILGNIVFLFGYYISMIPDSAWAKNVLMKSWTQSVNLHWVYKIEIQNISLAQYLIDRFKYKFKIGHLPEALPLMDSTKGHFNWQPRSRTCDISIFFQLLTSPLEEDEEEVEGRYAKSIWKKTKTMKNSTQNFIMPCYYHVSKRWNPPPSSSSPP